VLKFPDYGEDWNEWSYLQAGGFCLLIVGTIIYNEIIKMPCLEYAQPTKEELETLLENNAINYDVFE